MAKTVITTLIEMAKTIITTLTEMREKANKEQQEKNLVDYILVYNIQFAQICNYKRLLMIPMMTLWEIFHTQ